MCLWILFDLYTYYGADLSPGQFQHYFKVQKSTEEDHMYMISKRFRASLIFKNSNKTEYTDGWYEVSGKFYMGDIPLLYLAGNNYSFHFTFSVTYASTFSFITYIFI